MKILKKLWKWIEDGPAITEMAATPILIKPEKVGSGEWVDAERSLHDRYYELIFAVESKYDGESRHETALRYIRQAETHSETAQASTGLISRAGETMGDEPPRA